MKKLLLVLSLGLLAFSLPVNAATKDLGMITNDDFVEAKNQTSFDETWTFTVPAMAKTSIVIGNAFIGDDGKITNFAATLDNIALQLITTSSSQQTLEGMFDNLAAGVQHVLHVTGGPDPNNPASFGGSIHVAIAQSPVPVPAAMWLFGSALVGLAGLKRPKSRA